jgi:hypothetical protein
VIDIVLHSKSLAIFIPCGKTSLRLVGIDRLKADAENYAEPTAAKLPRFWGIPSLLGIVWRSA